MSHLLISVSWFGLDGGLFAPALFYAEGSTPTSAASCRAADLLRGVQEYQLDFVSHREVRHVSCIVGDSAGKDHSCHLSHRKVEDNKTLEESVPVEFSIPAESLPAGATTVRIDGDYANSVNSHLTAEVHFIHRPFTDPCR